MCKKKFNEVVAYRIDRYYMENKGSSGSFVPPGRPRKWKEKAMQTFQQTIEEAVEGMQIYSVVDKPVGWVAV